MEAALRGRYGATRSSCRAQRRVIALTPGGRLLDDALASELAAEPALTLLCGRYEGFDERILEHFCTERSRSAATCWPAASWRRWSSATRCCASSRARWATRTSAVEESFSQALEGAPEYPHYTRPAEWRGWAVPDVLLSGHHERIRRVAAGAEPQARLSGETHPLP